LVWPKPNLVQPGPTESAWSSQSRPRPDPSLSHHSHTHTHDHRMIRLWLADVLLRRRSGQPTANPGAAPHRLGIAAPSYFSSRNCLSPRRRRHPRSPPKLHRAAACARPLPALSGSGELGLWSAPPSSIFPPKTIWTILPLALMLTSGNPSYCRPIRPSPASVSTAVARFDSHGFSFSGCPSAPSLGSDNGPPLLTASSLLLLGAGKMVAIAATVMVELLVRCC
jgi:hypothetical protein